MHPRFESLLRSGMQPTGFQAEARKAAQDDDAVRFKVVLTSAGFYGKLDTLRPRNLCEHSSKTFKGLLTLCHISTLIILYYIIMHILHILRIYIRTSISEYTADRARYVCFEVSVNASSSLSHVNASAGFF